MPHDPLKEMNFGMCNWQDLPLEQDDDPERQPQGAGANLLNFEETLQYLISPDTKTRLHLSGQKLLDEFGNAYPMHDGKPWLVPKAALEFIFGRQLQISENSAASDPLAQYLKLSLIKASSGNSNLLHDDLWYNLHLRRSARFLSRASGLALDIGCDDPLLAAGLFPQAVRYIGLEPSLSYRSGFSIAGYAEFLPFGAGVFDCVSFLTSLDHVLDYHSALNEGWRVLKPGGMLYLASLIWSDHAELWYDNVHFHHFRQFEIVGALSRFEIKDVRRYAWKNDAHRYGVYVKAIKQ